MTSSLVASQRNVRVGGKGSGASGLESIGDKDQSAEVNVKTDQLIDMLSANLEPVNAGWLGKTLVLAILAGGTGAAVLMLATVQDLCRTHARIWLMSRGISLHRGLAGGGREI